MSVKTDVTLFLGQEVQLRGKDCKQKNTFLMPYIVAKPEEKKKSRMISLGLLICDNNTEGNTGTDTNKGVWANQETCYCSARSC